MKILNEDQFWDRLNRLNAFKADDPEGGSLTKLLNSRFNLFSAVIIYYFSVFLFILFI